jgi:crotonobetainyl-CoA:carnitine CoA-transferase CaiB-like acyl-CoA transferase
LYACPNQTYRTGDGTERYIAISCETNEQWQALIKVVGNKELTSQFGGDNLNSTDDRLVHEEEINEYLAQWCVTQDGRELESRLIDAGIPASVVQRTSELYSDDQITHRAFFETHEHALMGPTPYDGHSTIFSARPGDYLRGPGPIMGEHTFEVLADILGMTADDIGDAAASGTFS